MAAGCTRRVRQVRAARALLRWTIADLAKEAGIGISTVQEVEKVNGEPRVASTLQWRSRGGREDRRRTRGGRHHVSAGELGVGLRGRIEVLVLRSASSPLRHHRIMDRSINRHGSRPSSPADRAHASQFIK